MDADERSEERWSVDLESTVAKNVCWLRENRGISQEQFGADLYHHGFGMSQLAVAELEAGKKPLRLNEIAAIATYFEVPIQSLWQNAAETASELLAAVEAADAQAQRVAAAYYAQQRIERLRNKLAN
jgi:transcriptional regulator with XRE-family HTH domain